MRITERSYSTKSVRPRPVVHTEPDGSMIIISTSWGSPEAASKVNEDIVKYIQASLADVEVTSPYEFMSNLTDQTNYLRIAALISNESMYRSDNRVGYAEGVETLILLKTKNQIAYVQVGSPHLLIQKEGSGLVPIAVNYDSSLDFTRGEHALPPLPDTLLGTDLHLNIRCGDFRVEETDQLVLFAGNFWPESLWGYAYSKLDMQQLTQKMVQHNPDSPFWLGLIQLED